MSYMYLSDTVFVSFVRAYDLHVLSAIVAAKKISFFQMMVSPAASIIQFHLESGLQ